VLREHAQLLGHYLSKQRFTEPDEVSPVAVRACSKSQTNIVVFCSRYHHPASPAFGFIIVILLSSVCLFSFFSHRLYSPPFGTVCANPEPCRFDACELLQHKGKPSDFQTKTLPGLAPREVPTSLSPETKLRQGNVFKFRVLSQMRF